MRRTKEEVAPELPERTVIDEEIPLEGAQAVLYESIRTSMDRQVREAIAAKGVTASGMEVFEALLRLRQVCCDPGLVKLDAARKVTASAKRARLLALLEELVAEGRKVLVFSQFVEMLKLIERDIAARAWGYAMLHGATRDRDAQGRGLSVRRSPAVPGEPEGRRHGPQSHGRRHGDRLRSRGGTRLRNARPWTGRTASARTSRCSCTG